MSFFEKFFGYVEDENGSLAPYCDGLGKGAYSDYRHFIWIFLTVLLGFLLYNVFKKNKKAGRITVVVLSTLLLVTRTINQIYRGAIGAENPFWRAFPFHMCTVMTFLLPLTVLFKWEKIYTPVYVISMMGGIITILIGDYFANQFMTFSTLEGMSAHSLLILIPLICIAIDDSYELNFKNSYQVIIGMLVLMAWAEFANYVLFRNYDTNYMYLVRNALPGNIGGKFFFLIYVAVFSVFFILIFGLPTLYRNIKNKKKNAF